jgi:hypothetical protein
VTAVLNLLVSTLKLTAGARAAKAAAARAALAAALLLAALILLAIALGFGLLGAYGYLTTVMTAPAAAGLIAGGLAALALILVAAALWRPRRGGAATEDKGATASFSDVVDDLGAWARGNPTEAALSAFLLGMALSRRTRS